MAVPKRKIEANEVHDWGQILQFVCLRVLSLQSSFNANDIVFHGGTSLKLSWNSPRYSEDLDFMITKNNISKLPNIMNKVFSDMEIIISAQDPELKFRFTEKSRRDGELLNYMMILEKPNVMGNVKVKMEFWQVENDFFNKYKTTFRTPTAPDFLMHLQSQELLSVADKNSAYCDKMVALSTRPFVKWRDFFDIWWLRTQKDLEPFKEDGFIEAFKHNLSAYSIPEKFENLKGALEQYLKMDKEKLLIDSETELKKWLSSNLWQKLYPETVKEMLNLVQNDVKFLLSKLSEEDLNYTGKSETNSEITNSFKKLKQ